MSIEEVRYLLGEDITEDQETIEEARYGENTENGRKNSLTSVQFKNKVVKGLKSLGAEVSIKSGHGFFSGFASANDKFAYISITDEGQYMFRTAKNDKDFTGGSNQFAKSVNTMVQGVAKILGLEVDYDKLYESEVVSAEDSMFNESHYILTSDDERLDESRLGYEVGKRLGMGEWSASKKGTPKKDETPTEANNSPSKDIPSGYITINLKKKSYKDEFKYMMEMSDVDQAKNKPSIEKLLSDIEKYSTDTTISFDPSLKSLVDLILDTCIEYNDYVAKDVFKSIKKNLNESLSDEGDDEVIAENEVILENVDIQDLGKAIDFNIEPVAYALGKILKLLKATPEQIAKVNEKLKADDISAKSASAEEKKAIDQAIASVKKNGYDNKKGEEAIAEFLYDLTSEVNYHSMTRLLKSEKIIKDPF